MHARPHLNWHAVVQMWVAAVELLRRGAEITATDKSGRQPLDAAIARMCGDESAAAGALDRTIEEKLQTVRSSYKFRQLPDRRKRYAEEFLLAHLQSQSGQLAKDDASAAATDSVNPGE